MAKVKINRKLRNIAAAIAEAQDNGTIRRKKHSKGGCPKEKQSAEFRSRVFKPGQSGNPTGRPRTKVLSIAYKNLLAEEVPDAMFAQIGLAHLAPLCRGKGLSFAEVIAFGMTLAAAAGDARPAKELRETTEGRLPEVLNLAGTIDYSAGASAKEQLLDKLGNARGGKGTKQG